MSTQIKIIDLLGISGSGKGTEAELLCDKLNLDYMSTGELLRVRKETKDFSGVKIGDVIDSGKFVPSILIVKLWMDRLEEIKNQVNFLGFVLDGTPRKLLEAQLLDEALEWYGWSKYFHVLLIDVSEEEATSRLLNRRLCADCKKTIPYTGKFKNLKKCDACGGEFITREDDTLEGIKSRMNEYSEHVVPVIDYYEKQGRLTRINGEQSIEAVHRDIMKVISK